MERLGFIHEKLDIKILILFLLRRLPGAQKRKDLLALCAHDPASSYDSMINQPRNLCNLRFLLTD